MNKLKEFFKGAGVLNILSILIGVFIIIYTLYGFLSSLINLKGGLPGGLIFQLIWFGLGVTLISNGLYSQKKQSSVDVYENTTQEISYRKFLISIPIVIFIVCFTWLIINFINSEWVGALLLKGVWLFGFQFPLIFVAFFTKNKSTLQTVSVLSVILGPAIFLI